MASYLEPHPDLDAIKPGVKDALSDSEARKYDVCSSPHQSPLSFQTRDDGRISFIEHALKNEECEELCRVMDSSDDLSFWNDQGRGNEKARQFRDADTVEVNLPSLASTLWNRISDIFDKTPIVINHDDTEHVRQYCYDTPIDFSLSLISNLFCVLLLSLYVCRRTRNGSESYPASGFHVQ